MSMVIIGLAGESGTGKTTIGRHLADKFGGVHIDADRVGHDLLAGDSGVIAAVRKIAGDTVFDKQGQIDRRALGAVVFADPDKLKRYNAVIHPAIRRRCGEMVAQALAGGAALAAIDAALLLDSAMPFQFDLMVALRCDRDVQIQRLRDKGGRTAEEIAARLDNQRHIEKSFYKADAVVDTGVELEQMFERIDAIAEKVINDSEHRGET